jgi:hypothetical protein
MKEGNLGLIGATVCHILAVLYPAEIALVDRPVWSGQGGVGRLALPAEGLGI